MYVPNYEEVPGSVRGRRWKCVTGAPYFWVVYAFGQQHGWESAKRADQRDFNQDKPRMPELMKPAPGLPEDWPKTFQA